MLIKLGAEMVIIIYPKEKAKDTVSIQPSLLYIFWGQSQVTCNIKTIIMYKSVFQQIYLSISGSTTNAFR